jgi:hypothetical protein
MVKRRLSVAASCGQLHSESNEAIVKLQTVKPDRFDFLLLQGSLRHRRVLCEQHKCSLLRYLCAGQKATELHDGTRHSVERPSVPTDSVRVRI